MILEKLAVELGLGEDTSVPAIVEAYERVCDSCRTTMANSVEKVERRMARQKLQEIEDEIGPSLMKYQARFEINRRLEESMELLRTGFGSVGPYLAEMEKWLPLCDDRSLELKVAAFKESLLAKVRAAEETAVKKPNAHAGPVMRGDALVQEVGTSSDNGEVSGENAWLIRERNVSLVVGGMLTRFIFQDSVLFGRSTQVAGCDIRMGMPSTGSTGSASLNRMISRRHFQIMREGNQVLLYDGFLGSDGAQRRSSGGVFVDGVAVVVQRIDNIQEGLLTVVYPNVREGLPAYRWRWSSGNSLIMERADCMKERVLMLWGSLSLGEISAAHHDVQVVLDGDGYYFRSKKTGILDPGEAEVLLR